MIYFIKKAKPKEVLVRTSFGFTVKPTGTIIKWLGIYFNRKLTFKHYIRTWVSTAIRVANHLKSLNRITKGFLSLVTAKAAAACVLPIAIYGVKAW